MEVILANSYHPNARTTVQIRREIVLSTLGTKDAAIKFNVHENTIRKWRKRELDNLKDLSHATTIRSYTLTEFEQNLIAAVKKITLFSIDDLLEVLKPFIKNLNRDNLYTTLKQRGINRNDLFLPPEESEKPVVKKFKNYEPGYIHIDIKYLPKMNGERKYLFVAIDRKTRLVFIKIYKDKTAKSAEDFLEESIKFFPFKITRLLTDNGKEFTDRFRPKTDFKPTGNHILDKKCELHNIEHRLTKSKTPQTNGMVERMNRRIVDNVLKPIIFKDYNELELTIKQYIDSYNLHIRQKNIDYLSPVEFLKKNYSRVEWEYKKIHNHEQVYNYQILYLSKLFPKLN
jgi:transposase InsO family protein